MKTVSRGVFFALLVMASTAALASTKWISGTGFGSTYNAAANAAASWAINSCTTQGGTATDLLVVSSDFVATQWIVTVNVLCEIPDLVPPPMSDCPPPSGGDDDGGDTGPGTGGPGPGTNEP